MVACNFIIMSVCLCRNNYITITPSQYAGSCSHFLLAESVKCEVSLPSHSPTVRLTSDSRRGSCPG